MKKRSVLNSVAVKTPCTQDWNLMYGNDEVRFCEHCVKHVHDLSAMTRKEAEKFAAASNSSVCVRYIRRPDGNIQTASDRLYQISGRASRLAAGVFGASLSLASSAYAQETVLVPLPVRGQAVSTDTPKIETQRANVNDAIFGTVSDPMGAVVPGAEVILTDQKTGATQTVRSDSEGYYSFTTVEEGTYKLEFKSPGFTTRIIENIGYKARSNAKFDVTLDVGAIMGDMMVSITPQYENQLVRAVLEKVPERIDLLIAQGANVNEKDNNGGVTALHIAVREGDLENVRMLLKFGAKVNARDDQGRTALMHIGEGLASEESDEGEENAGNDQSDAPDETAAETGTNPARVVSEIFGLLIAHGAKINLRDSEGFTALMCAAQKYNPQLLQLLIVHRANLNIQSKTGRTALIEAVDAGELENVKILLQAGADVNLKDDDGKTALSLSYDDEIEQLLLSYGAKPEEMEEPEDN